MGSTHVKINAAPLGEIATLYDIGRYRAERIIEYRDNHGPFHGPEDLAKVDGITINLALTLAPHIDWDIPVEPTPLKRRDWVEASYWVVILLVVLCSITVLIRASASKFRA